MERQAICTCKKVVPSKPDLAFFEFTGEGSEKAKTSCKNCGFHAVAHTPETMARNKNLKCTDFVARGPFEFDFYYCGCRGWD